MAAEYNYAGAAEGEGVQDDGDLKARVAAVEQQQLDARRYEDAERLVEMYPRSFPSRRRRRRSSR